MLSLFRGNNDKAMHREVNKVVIITDAGRDHDDEIALTVAAGLSKAGMLEVECVVANLQPALMRARLVKGILDTVGLSDVPVGVGTVVNENSIPQPYEFDASYLSQQQSFQNGQELLKETFIKAENNSLTLLLISGLTDANLFLQNNIELAKRKLNKIVIMGGVAADQDDVKRDDKGFILPDESYNHKVDMKSALSFYECAQAAKIPLTIVSRFAAMACSMSPKFYEYLAKIDSPIGKRLCEAHAHSIRHLWHRVFMDVNDEKREGLPAYCNKEWFLKTFTDNNGDTANLTQNDDIWPHVTKINAYDPIAMLAAVLPNEFVPRKVKNGGIENLVIGLNAKITGVNDRQRIRNLLTSLSASGLARLNEFAPSREGFYQVCL